MKLKLAAVALLAVVGVGALAYTFSGANANTSALPEYLTASATVGNVTDDIAATGTIKPASRTGVAFGVDPFLVDGDGAPSAPTTYRVTEVSVEIGDTVAVGAPLASAETTALQRDLKKAKNDLLAAGVSLRAAEDDLESAEDDDVTAQVRQAKVALYNARNQVASAEDAVADRKDQIAGATLTATVAGVVTSVNVVAGFDAPAGAAVVIDSTTLEVTTDVVESDLADVAIGQPAAITVGAVGAELTGRVTAIAPTAGEDSGTGVVSFPVTVTLTDPPTTVKSGMSADVTVTTASAENVLTVPSAALSGSAGNYRVMTLGADGTPVTTVVEVGLVTNTTAEIRSGLAEGTAVVTGTASDLAGTTGTGAFGGGGVVTGPVGGGAFPGGGQFNRPGAGNGN